MGDLYAIGHQLSVWFLPIILAITLHEAAHAWAADKLGDDTSRRLGRVSINPVRHVDPLGTLILPGLLLLFSPIVFGWAKPVPVNFARLGRPKRDMALVAAAGPLCNLLQAIFFAWAIVVVLPMLEGNVQAWVGYNFANAILVNLILAIFNLFPLPPLDGGRIVTSLLPRHLAYRYAGLERYGLLILLLLLFAVPLVGRQVGLDFNPVFAFVFGLLQPAVWLVAALSPIDFDLLWRIVWF
ncbi:MAG: site-2 protease family protein [Geminicoccaceae bacterium]|nr:MAG: site-2 protease family protein [Geminicoccaceae bacterium]